MNPKRDNRRPIVLSDPDLPAPVPVPLADLEALRKATEQYTRPFDSITVRPEHEALARERLSPPEVGPP